MDKILAFSFLMKILSLRRGIDDAHCEKYYLRPRFAVKFELVHGISDTLGLSSFSHR